MSDNHARAADARQVTRVGQVGEPLRSGAVLDGGQAAHMTNRNLVQPSTMTRDGRPAPQVMQALPYVRDKSQPAQAQPAQAQPAQAQPAQPGASTARSTALLAVLLTAVFMAVLDVTIVNVAGPVMERNLHATGAELQLIISAYTMAYAVLIVTGARLGAMFGFRRVFLAGVAVFSLGSLGCALAPDAPALIGLRVLQGAGAALMMPQVLSLLQMTFSGPARPKVFGRYAAVISSASVFGQVVGGALLSANLFSESWRPVFMLNVPIGAVLFWVGLRILPAGGAPTRRNLDFVGLISLAIAVVLFVVPVVMGHQENWPIWAIVALAATAPALALFVLVERRVEHRGGTPMVPARVVKAKSFALSLGSIGLAMATYGGYLFSMVLYLEQHVGDSPLQTGLAFLPGAVTFAFASLGSRRVGGERAKIAATCGLVGAAVGYGAIALELRGGGSGGTLLEVLFAIAGAGLGTSFTPLFNSALANVASADAADASGVVATVQQLSLVSGVSLFGSLFLALRGPLSSGGHPGGAAGWTMFMLFATAVLGGALSSRTWLRRAPRKGRVIELASTDEAELTESELGFEPALE